MKRIFALLRRDILSISRDAIMLYAIIVPVILALVIRLFMPSLQQASITVVITEQSRPALAAPLEPYLDVEVVADRAALEQRVLAFDDTVGIVPAEGTGYRLVLQGNESHDAQVLPEMVLNKAFNDSPTAITVTSGEVAGAGLPWREWTGIFLVMLGLSVGSMVMCFTIVEDKESNMMQALGVTPLSRREYLAARSLLAILQSVVIAFAILWALGLSGFNGWLLLAIMLSSALLVLLMGFVLGALSNNQIVAIANVKFSSLVFMAPVIIALFLPQQWEWLLYWVPSYWPYEGLRRLLLEQADWALLWPALAGNLAAGALAVAAGYAWLRGRLQFARD